MRPAVLQTLLLLGIALGVAGHLLLRPDPSRRNLVYAPDMMVAPSFHAQDPNENFPDGKTLQRPPPGTVARGFLPPEGPDGLLDLAEPDWAKLSPAQQAAWDRYAPPWAGTELDEAARTALLARGAQLYARFCVTCHGPQGAGDGPSVKRGVTPPPSYASDDVRLLSDGHLFRSITRGKGNMSAYAAQVTREDRWKVILYVRSLSSAP